MIKYLSTEYARIPYFSGSIMPLAFQLTTSERI